MERKILLSLICLFAFFLGIGSVARACPCPPPPSVCEAYNKATAIFVGRVIGAATKNEIVGEDGTKHYYCREKIEFEVEEAFLGVSSERITIDIGSFELGEKYLVYANTNNNKELWAGPCGGRTKELAKASEDLKFLRDLPSRGPGVRIFGKVSKPLKRVLEDPSDFQGMLDITITIKTPKGDSIQLLTDTEGRYDIEGLEPGEYQISATLPDYYYQGSVSRKVLIKDHSCACEEFTAIVDGVLSGKIVDSDGNPLKSAQVLLVSADATAPLTDEGFITYVEFTDDDGNYEFTQIRPGRYLTGINLHSSPNEEAPFLATYYPGVTERASASVIEVGLGEKVHNIDFKPQRLTGYKVEGTVIWPDGKPVAGAYVHLIDTDLDDEAAWTETDGSGHFTLMGFENFNYRLTASKEFNISEVDTIQKETDSEDSVIEVASTVSESSDQVDSANIPPLEAELRGLKLRTDLSVTLVLNRATEGSYKGK